MSIVAWLRGRDTRSPSNRPRRRNRPSPLAVEALEGRRVLSGPSVNVAMIGGRSITNGGFLPNSGADLTGINFTLLAPGTVTAANLTSFDTVILNVGGSGIAGVPNSGMNCNVNRLSNQAKTDLVSFVGGGKKLIIYTSECGAQDFTWLPYPFNTSNPGAGGASGTLNITEDSPLGCRISTLPCFIDAPAISTTDAVGDSNVMTTFDANWCLAESGTNRLGVTGPVRTYATFPPGTDQGLIIYNGLDVDSMANGPSGSGAGQLRKLYVLELTQTIDPSNLPCGATVVGISLAPTTATHKIGRTHTVTATLSDLTGAPLTGLSVTFTVLSGPNIGATGTCNPINCSTNSSGQVTFTYTGTGGLGTDSIQASFVNSAGRTIVSRTVTAVWIANQAPIANADGPYTVAEGSTVALNGTGSTDPDGTIVSFEWDFGCDGTVDATGATPTFSAAGLDGPSTRTACLRVTDEDGANSSATATVNITNVAPANVMLSLSPQRDQ